MTIEEHFERIQAAIDAAEAEGYLVDALTCCCDEGLQIRKVRHGEPEQVMRFNV